MGRLADGADDGPAASEDESYGRPSRKPELVVVAYDRASEAAWDEGGRVRSRRIGGDVAFGRD